MPFNLTTIDMVEKLGQIMYIGQLLLTPSPSEFC
jgi:hypothetical protein